ncbi:carotenoid biosynthesis protein [Nitrosomonas oligotropha]|uniref:Putative membrane protein n=1 Tax=Nitrosomonas oligotropha TaxID=42354 RepID=A0A1H8KJ08_9PROT|nr:carotenoid biosynthesis protein [Nitrosomonas oligotropha]SDW32255.1 putative membrane protein [Nitrosomonas oligotropha]SEN92855.1 putative membrane protein [Nitrosomonas oligotropha]
MFDAAIDTIVMRPYVFTFFAAFLLACVPHLGWRKTLIFTLAGYLIAFTSEKLSITTGFPYGWYYYIDDTSHQELWVWGVPFFDSLSYVFLTYCSYTTALFILSPLATKGTDLITLETRAIRHSWAALILGAFLQTFLDIIIDPVALQGNRWFLGQIYGYYEAGLHFGVPISNYLGWLLTSFLLVAALQQIDRKRDGKTPRGIFAMPFRSLLGPVLYLSVLVFNWIVTLWIGEYLIALTGILIFTLPIVMVIVLAALRVNRYRAEELQEHLENYPWSPLNKS